MAQAPTKNRSGYVVFFGTLLVMAVVLGFLGWQRGWLFGGPRYTTPALSPSYLPADTAAVIHVNLRELEDSKGVSKDMGAALHGLLTQVAPNDLRTALAVDPERDIEWMQLSLQPGDKNHPVDMMLLLHGNFDPQKFKLDPKGFHQVNKPGDRYRVYELPDERWSYPFTLTPGDHAVLLSDHPARIATALRETAEDKTPPLEDEALAERLDEINQMKPKPTIWGAASLKKLRQEQALPPFSDTVLEHYLRPILDDTDLMYGTIACGNTINGTIHFQTDSDEKATRLAKYLNDKVLEAKVFYGPARILKLKSDYLGLLQLFSSGEVKRDGRTVTLNCHLP